MFTYLICFSALRYLYCFSILRNWKKFIASPGEGQDPRLKALTGIHGIRLSINLVIKCIILSDISFFTAITINQYFFQNAVYYRRVGNSRRFQRHHICCKSEVCRRCKFKKFCICNSTKCFI